MSTRLALPARRSHVTQKVRIAGQRTLYVSVHDDPHPAEVFLRVKGPDCSSELIGLYDVIARLMSIAHQYGASLEQIGDLLTGAQFEPCGCIFGHYHLTHCSTLPSLISRLLTIAYAGQTDSSHRERSTHA